MPPLLCEYSPPPLFAEKICKVAFERLLNSLFLNQSPPTQISFIAGSIIKFLSTLWSTVSFLSASPKVFMKITPKQKIQFLTPGKSCKSLSRDAQAHC